MSASSPRFQIYQDTRGEWRWTLYAPNGLKIADSAEGYVDKRNCLHGVMIVKGYAPKARVDGAGTTHADALVSALLARQRRTSMLGS